MIAIGCATTDERAFRAAGALTIGFLDEGDSLLLRRHCYDSIGVPYNEMLDVAATRDDLEAIVFVHQDAVLERVEGVLTEVRALLGATPDVVIVGALDGGAPREVETLPGTLIVLSAWAVRNLRFDPDVGSMPDTAAQDISLQARAAGRRVVGAQLGAARGWLPTSPADRRRELQATVGLRRKWTTEPGASGQVA